MTLNLLTHYIFEQFIQPFRPACQIQRTEKSLQAGGLGVFGGGAFENI